MLFVHHDMQFVTEVRLFPFLCPGAVPAPPGPGLLSPGRVRRFMAGIGGDETRVLDNPLPNFQTLYLDLRLQLIPNRLLFPAPDQPFPEVPEGGVIRYLLRESQELPEGYAVVGLPLHLWIGETAERLEDKHLHQQNLVGIQSSALIGVVVINLADDGTEGLPFDQGLQLRELVAESLDVFVLLVEGKIDKIVHYSGDRRAEIELLQFEAGFIGILSGNSRANEPT